MHLECPSCHHLVEFSAEPPSFCAYCGKAIEVKGGTTVDYNPEAVTLPPSDSAACTLGSIPESVGGYRILRPLGSGGMGTVYEAEDASSGCHVALKLIAPEFATSRDAVDRFRQEGRLASVIVHPRCVFVFAVDEQAGQPYIAMELMPGVTLQDLVKDRGPLPIEEGVAKILDVIDGLQEVHRLGVVHRDIKPANCFLEADGRVKIGDFGLSKSLVRETHLTKTGLFLGTPLYASPEQIKMERVDAQSDLYAVAASLYFLLTGRAPHQTGDMTATVARIISDPVPSMRFLRPELPTELDRVVLRGLERDRKHRWKSLQEFQSALAPFGRRRLSIGRIGLRVGAYVVDLLLFYLAAQLAAILFIFRFGLADSVRLGLIVASAEDIVWIAYFTLLEGIWGCSLGKRLLRLRVCSTATGAQLAVARALGRTLIFHVLVNLGWPIAAILSYVYVPSSEPGPSGTAKRAMIGALGPLWSVVGIVVIGSTMRKRHGYRALHDLLGGSRVVHLPWPARQRKWRQQAKELATLRPDGLPERIDQFIIKGAFRWTEQEGVLLAEDAVLNRKVWLWLRPPSAGPLPEARRQIARPARLRWLDSGHTGDWQWDAFLAAPAGWTLPNLIAREKQFSWAEARPWLEQLDEELVAANREGTLPSTLTADRVWVQANGRIQLLETSLDDVGAAANRSACSDQEAALSLLREVALLTLEGRSRPAGEKPALRAPVPEHATPMLNRLLLVDGLSFGSVEEFHADLAATQDMPTEVTTTHRGAHLALLTGAIFLPLLMMFALSGPMANGTMLRGFANESSGDSRKAAERAIHTQNPIASSLRMSPPAIYIYVITVPLIWVLWAFLLRGGFTFRLAGIALLRSNGRKALRIQCVWRALLVWAPIAVPLALSVWLNEACLAAWLRESVDFFRWASWLAWVCWSFALALLPLYTGLALWMPSRSVHDRLAGTYLVPR